MGKAQVGECCIRAGHGRTAEAELVEIQAACEDTRKRVGEMEQESEKLEEECQSLAQGEQAKAVSSFYEKYWDCPEPAVPLTEAERRFQMHVTQLLLEEIAQRESAVDMLSNNFKINPEYADEPCGMQDVLNSIAQAEYVRNEL